MKNHIRMVRKLFGPCGLTGLEVLQGVVSADGPAPAKIIALLRFETADGIKKALETHGAAVLGDIANFTPAKPSIQFNEALT